MFRKDDRGIPGSTALEATGLRWLTDAMDDGGAAVVPVRSGRGWLEEPQLNDRRCTSPHPRRWSLTLGCTAAGLGR